jgi:hypothetical protein
VPVPDHSEAKVPAVVYVAVALVSAAVACIATIWAIIVA